MNLDANKDAAPRAQPDATVETRSHELAHEYVRLGGKRRAKIDDNITDVRQWEDDPAEAEQFWQKEIASLPEAERKEVETLLPTINSR